MKLRGVLRNLEQPGLLARLRREAFEHLPDIPIERLRIFSCVGREISRSQSSPQQLLGAGIEQIDHQIGDGLICRGRRSFSDSGTPTSAPTPSTPASACAPTAAPAAAQIVIEGLGLLLVMHVVGSKNSDGPSRRHHLPALRLQLRVDGLLNAPDIKWVSRLYLCPRVGMVLAEVRLMVVVGPHIVAQRGNRRPQ